MQDLYKVSHCPGCLTASEKSDTLFEATILGSNCTIKKCTVCGLVYKEFFPTAAGLDRIYSAEYTHFNSGGEWRTKSFYNSAKQKLDSCRKLAKGNRPHNSIRVLDVGCGAGNFVSVARDLGYNACGIDPHLPSHCQHPYLERKKLEEMSPASFDMVVLLNVAEHLVNPREFFQEVYRVLAPDGIMLLTCPYGNSLARRFYNIRWTHLVLDEHLLFWTPGSLSAMLRQIGFTGNNSFRIAGSPFPSGRVKNIEVNDTVEPVADTSEVVPVSNKTDLRAYINQFALFVQSHERTANYVRDLVHFSSSGDYLEYVIARNK